MNKDIHWIETFGQNLIKNISLTIGGTVVQHLDGSGNAIIEHINGKEEECHFCKKKDRYTGTDFQYYFGTKHIRKQDRWEGYIGELLVDSLSDEYIELWEKLSE